MARSGVAARRAGAGLAALLLGACTWQPWIPSEPPPPAGVPGRLAKDLPLDETRRAVLDCPGRDDCNDRWRVTLGQGGRLRVVLRALEPAPGVAARLVLEGPSGVVAQRAGTPGQAELTLAATVGPGPHGVLVQALGGSLRYELLAGLETP